MTDDVGAIRRAGARTIADAIRAKESMVLRELDSQRCGVGVGGGRDGQDLGVWG